MALTEGYHRSADEGQAIWFLDTLMTVKAGGTDTHDAFTFIDCLAPSGFAPPLHVHHGEDEAFYLLAGEMTVQCGERTWSAGPGSFVLLPREVPHAFLVTSEEPCRLLQVTSPAGFERFIDELGRPAQQLALPAPTEPDVASLAATAPHYGYEILGPPLGATTPAATGE